jgi:hypothetical protein
MVSRDPDSYPFESRECVTHVILSLLSLRYVLYLETAIAHL